MRTIDELGISPAPWKRTGDWIVANANYDPIDGTTESTRVVETKSDDDARLIAAAPDCLMSLAETLDALKNRLPSKPTLDELEIINRAEAAIRKATDESEVAK